MKGAFSKTLLESIDEIDSNGDPFYKYEFDYYNDINGQHLDSESTNYSNRT